MKEIEIPEGYEARIEGNKVILELKESEDERIRKLLLNYFKFHLSRSDIYINNTMWEGVKVSDIIAYLEKQKDQTPIFRVGDTIIAKDGTGIPQEAFYIERIEDGFYWEKDNTILISNQDEFQLVKQKPAWSEEDEKILADTIFKLAGFMGNEKNLDWLKSLRPSWKPSKEQIYTLERICSNLHLRASDDAPKLDEIIEQLKRL